jgi:hypothetical protein
MGIEGDMGGCLKGVGNRCVAVAAWGGEWQWLGGSVGYH